MELRAVHTFQVASTEYDALGRVTRSIDSCTSSGTTVPATPVCTAAGTQDAETNVITTWTYDAAGNQLSETAPSPAGATGTDPGTVTTRYAYDGVRRLCRVVENASTDLQTLAVPCATAISGTVSSNVSTRYGYDGASNLTSMIDARGNTTTYGFDAAGRIISRTDANSKTVAWQYDQRGNRTGQIDRVGSPAVGITWTYDGADRITSRTADGDILSYTYDTGGNRLTAVGPDGAITSTHDRLGRVLTVDADDGSDTGYTYSHTAPARMDPSGSYTFTLDEFGRETGATTPLATIPFNFAYRADGRPMSKDDPNDNSTAFSYDNAGRLLTKLTTGSGGSPTRAFYSYTYNRAGLRLSEASTITNDPANGTASFAYDALGRLTGYTSPLGASSDREYGWEKVLNRSTVTAGSTTVTTAYDTADRPTSDSAGSSYAHDTDGRLTARPGQTLEWDSLGRVTKVRDAATSSVISEYTYDALDRLRTVGRSSGTIRFRYVGETTLAAEVVDDGTAATIMRLANSWGGERLGQSDNSTVRYHGINAHFDTTWMADATGGVEARLRYDPWGNVVSSSGMSLPEWRFQGSWLDVSTNLYWVESRWYAAELGAFISEDELLGVQDRPAARHLRAYGHGDPINKYDPNGRYPFSPNDREWEKCNANWGRCLTWMDASVAAWSIGKATYPRDGQREDALRHCTWQCLLTYSLGYWAAFDWGRRHEPPNAYTSPSLSTRMDLHNNRVGRTIGSGMRGDMLLIMFPSLVLVYARGRCLEAMARGSLVFVFRDKLIQSSR